jgi:hypothetical protein
MAFLLDEERFVEENILKYDERLENPSIRFLEQTPTFVTYFHININESTSDEGFKDIETVIGNKSPLRFQKIEKFPIYGLDQIILQLEDTDVGIDSSYEGEAVILPNTVKALPNDYFVIPYVGESHLFRVTSIEHDNIRPDNFYKIHFKLDTIDEDKRESLDKQVHDKYTCIMENIGSENKCIIQEDYKERLDIIDKMYSDMVSLYLSIFYNDRYNILLGEMDNGYSLYDPYMTTFINNHSLFQKKNSLETIFLEEDEFFDNKKTLKYERSIYRFFERKDINLLKPFLYTTFKGMGRKESAFAKWEDESVYVVDLPSMINPENCYRILSDHAVETIRLNGPTNSKYMELIKKFIRNEKIGLFDIDTSLNDELIKLDANLEMFFITPLLLYIIKEVIKEFYKTGVEFADEV